MKKILLSKKFIKYDFKPENLKVNNDDLKNHILSHQHNIDENDCFNKYKNYINLNYFNQIQWLRDYFSEIYFVEYNTHLVHLSTSAIIINSKESILLHNHIDSWQLPNQPDVSAIYVVSQGDAQSNIVFEYDDNRFKDKKHKIPLENNKIIFFNSTLFHHITKNNNLTDTILLSIKYQYVF